MDKNRKAKRVSVCNVTKIFMSHGKNSEFKAVDNVSVDIAPGEFVTLLGPSGCGKTTILRMIAGFELPTEGEIYLDDQIINNLTPDKRDTSMVFQSYALFPHLDIYQNIIYGLQMKHMSKEEITKKADAIIDLVGLRGMEKRQPNQISGGQQQRVALARALVMEPGVLLFDEPLSNLDAKLRLYMRNEIKKLQRAVGITAIYVTHDQAEAMSLSDRIIIMKDGVIEQVGSPREIYYQPASEFVANFIGDANFFDVTVEAVENGLVLARLGEFRFQASYAGTKRPGDKARLVIRPEEMTIGKDGIISGTVSRSTFMGAEQEYTVETDSGLLELVVSNPKDKLEYDEGETVKIGFGNKRLHVI